MKSSDSAVAVTMPPAVEESASWSRPREIDSIDVRLVRECLAGDEEAWSKLLERYKRLIYSIPVKYGFSTQDASDIFQDVCLELLAELPRLREPRALPKWIGQVTSHKCAHLKRVTARQILSASLSEDALDNMADSHDLAEQVLVEVEREQALRDVVTALPPRCHQLIHALFFETPSRPYREIAKELNLAGGSIGFIRGRCLGRLRSELHKYGFR